jgi:hypothetical protein
MSSANFVATLGEGLKMVIVRAVSIEFQRSTNEDEINPRG